MNEWADMDRNAIWLAAKWTNLRRGMLIGLTSPSRKWLYLGGDEEIT